MCYKRSKILAFLKAVANYLVYKYWAMYASMEINMDRQGRGKRKENL